MDFVGRRRLFLGVSGALVAASIVLLLTLGLNLGIDFSSGTSITYEFTGDDPGTALVVAGELVGNAGS